MHGRCGLFETLMAEGHYLNDRRAEVAALEGGCNLVGIETYHEPSNTHCCNRTNPTGTMEIPW